MSQFGKPPVKRGQLENYLGDGSETSFKPSSTKMMGVDSIPSTSIKLLRPRGNSPTQLSCVCLQVTHLKTQSFSHTVVFPCTVWILLSAIMQEVAILVRNTLCPILQKSIPTSCCDTCCTASTGDYMLVISSACCPYRYPWGHLRHISTSTPIHTSGRFQRP